MPQSGAKHQSTRVTIADVAREAIVSKATVSMALRGMPEISESTRKRVVEVAQKLGYRADPSLSRIAASRWRNRKAEEGSVMAFIDFVKEDVDEIERGRLDKRSGVLGAKEKAQELGYGFSYSQVSTARELQQLTRVLHHRGIQGVVLSRVFSEEMFEVFPWDKFAVVAEGDHCGVPPVDSICLDAYNAISMAATKTIDAGHCRIGLVLPDDDTQFSKNLVFRGVFEGLMRFGNRGKDARSTVHMHQADQSFALLQWIRENELDAVIGYSDEVLEPLTSIGMKCPDDFTFISLNAARDGSLAGVIDASHRIGALSVEHADRLLRRGSFGIPAEKTNYAVSSSWNAGESMSAEARVTKANESTYERVVAMG